MTFTNEKRETTLLGIVQGDGDREGIPCHGATAAGSVSNPITLNWIKQQIKKNSLEK